MMHFVAGDATITAADGEVHDVRPGLALCVPAGWRGRWEVRSTVRKTYAIVQQDVPPDAPPVIDLS